MSSAIGGELPPDPAGVRRLAIVRPRHLGDLLLTTPAFRSLRAGFPAAEIVLIGLPWAAEFVRRQPTLDRFLAFEGYPGMGEVDVDPSRLEPFLDRLRAEAFDLAVLFHPGGPADDAFLATLGARFTAGYARPGYRARFSLARPFVEGVHEVHKNLALAAALGAPPSDDRLDFPVETADHEAACQLLPAEWLASAAPLVVVHPSARAPARRWPPDRFARVADGLIERAGAHIAFVGAAAEADVVVAAARQMDRRDGAVVLAGRTSLGALAALIARARLFVGNDSGPNHLATAVGTPSVVVAGPADPRRWRPLDASRHHLVYRGAECSPCPHWECPIDHRCLTAVQVAEVLAPALRLLSSCSVAGS